MNKVRIVLVVLLAALSPAGPARAQSAPPDLAGVYWATRYNARIQILGGGELPLTAAGKAAYDKNVAGLRDGSMIDEARKFCLPDGIPRVLATPYPFQIFQQPTQVAMIHELNHQVRIIPLNKPVEKTFEVIALPHYNGHSFGRYEGDTLVIETIGFIEKCLFILPDRLNHQRVAFVTAERMAVVVRECNNLEGFFNRLVERDDANLMVEFVDHRDLGRLLEYLERIGRRQYAWYPVGQAELARLVDHRPVPQPRDILVIGRLPGRRKRQLAAAENLNPGVVAGRPVDAREIGRRGLRLRRTGRRQCREQYDQDDADLIHRTPPSTRDP